MPSYYSLDKPVLLARDEAKAEAKPEPKSYEAARAEGVLAQMQLHARTLRNQKAQIEADLESKDIRVNEIAKKYPEVDRTLIEDTLQMIQSGFSRTRGVDLEALRGSTLPK